MLPPESAIDVSRWAALDWSEGTLENSERRNRVAVRDVIPWGSGFMAVGWAEDWSMDPPARALVWLSDDGLEWRLVSDDSATFAAMQPCCVMRARDAYIVWTRDSGSFLSSVDGATWTRTEHNGGGEEFVAAETSDGLFGLATPFDGRAWTTVDGVAWEPIQTTGLELKALGPGQLGLLVTNFGYLLAAEASAVGIHDGCVRWANWQSPDGVSWREIRLADGPSMDDGARNAAWFSEGHRFVYARERPSCGVTFDWAYVPVWRSEDGMHWEIDEGADPNAAGTFPDAGRFDGQFTLDLSGLSDGETIRLSADGATFMELEATVPQSVPYDGWPSAVGSAGVVLFRNDSGPKPSVWLGHAVIDVPSSAKPAAYCRGIDAAVCLYVIGQVANDRTAEGTAFVVSGGCSSFDWSCAGDQFHLTLVPPEWPDAGRVQRWLYRAGEVSRARGGGRAGPITPRLVGDGPWRDAVIGDQLWVQLRDVDANSVWEVMSDAGLTALTVSAVGDVLWYGVGIMGRWPIASKLAELRADPRICAADFIRFDPTVLKGSGKTALLPPPDNPGCD